MAQVPAVPDAAALAARLDDVPNENTDAVVPAPAQIPEQEPQAVNAANVDQPAQGQAQEAQQPPEVCFCLFGLRLYFLPLVLHFLPGFGSFHWFSAFLLYRVLSLLWGRAPH